MICTSKTPKNGSFTFPADTNAATSVGAYKTPKKKVPKADQMATRRSFAVQSLMNDMPKASQDEMSPPFREASGPTWMDARKGRRRLREQMSSPALCSEAGRPRRDATPMLRQSNTGSRADRAGPWCGAVDLVVHLEAVDLSVVALVLGHSFSPLQPFDVSGDLGQVVVELMSAGAEPCRAFPPPGIRSNSITQPLPSPVIGYLPSSSPRGPRQAPHSF